MVRLSALAALSELPAATASSKHSFNAKPLFGLRAQTKLKSTTCACGEKGPPLPRPLLTSHRRGDRPTAHCASPLQRLQVEVYVGEDQGLGVTRTLGLGSRDGG